MQPTPQPPNEPADPRTESLPTDDSRTDRLAPSPPARWEWWILGGILLLGFALRATYLVDLSHTPDFFFPKVDAEFHDYWARGAVSGDWRTRPAHDDPRIYETPYLRPPGYPLFLALVYWATGSSYVAARMVQMLLGLVNVVLAFGLARALFGRAAGLVSALLLATYWAFIYFEGELLAPVLLVFLLLAILHLAHLWAVRAGWVFALATGIAIGLFSVVRPNGLLFLPVVAGWMVWLCRKEGKKIRSTIQPLLALALGAALAIAPVTVRNAVVGRDTVLISANGGINLFLGNNEEANGQVASEIPGLGRFGTCFDYGPLVQNVEKEVGRPLQHSEVSRYFARRAMRYMAENPARTLALTARKALLFWGPAEITHNQVVHYDRVMSRVLAPLPGNFSWALSLFLFGATLFALDLRSRNRSQSATPAVAGLALLLVLTYFLSFLPFFCAARYRVPIIPVLLLFGSYGIVRVGGTIRRRESRPALVMLVAFGALFLLCSWQVVPYKPDLADWHLRRGASYCLIDDRQRGIWHLRRSLTLDWANDVGHHALAQALDWDEQWVEAIRHYREALRLAPGNPEIRTHLATAIRRAGHTTEASALPQEPNVEEAAGDSREEQRQ